MTFSDPRSHSEPSLKSLRLLKFSDIIHLEILSFVYQWYHKLSTSCFVSYFNPVSLIHSAYNTRRSKIDNLFVKPVDTTQYGIRSLSYTGPKLWNSLSIDVKKINRFPVFVNISRILRLMVIILLLIPNVLRLYSLRSKRFQSSYCAKVRAEAIKKRSFFPLPLPRHSFFCSLPNFLDELAWKRLLRRLTIILS